MATEDALLGPREANFRHAKTTSLAIFFAAMIGAIAVAAVLVVLGEKQRRAFVAQSAFFTSLIESIADPIFATSPDGAIVVANAAARSMFPQVRVGATLGELVDATPIFDANGEKFEPRARPLARALAGNGVDSALVSIRSKEERWLTVTSRTVRDPDDAIIGAVAVYRDVTTEKKHADEVRALSVTDSLTHTHNRRGFFLLAEQHAKLAARTRAPFTVMFADLDGLKAINDRCGHEAGDAAIAAGASVLRACLRESDIVARLGGDELVALVAHADGRATAELDARIQHAVARFNASEDRPWKLAMSLGFATFDPSKPSTLNELVIEADRRMYTRKRSSRQRSKTLTFGILDTSTSSADRAPV
jgi:diguanylate cyclase (GGDEF)-like protein/PAS domain S-box-containing protein